MPMYGATEGIQAQEESNRRSLAAGLSAQKTLGEIAAQPTDIAYKQALTRTHTATADEAESALAPAKASRDLQLKFLEQRQEDDARKKLTEAAAGQGKQATVADLPPGGSIVRASQADDLEAFAEFARDTMPPMELANLRGEIAEIKRKEAAEVASRAAAGVNEHKQQVAQFQLIGNIAGAAGASEANYRAIMMSPQRQLLPRELTGNWRTDAPMLKAIEMASQDSIKRADLLRTQLDSESKRRLDGARVSEATTRVENLKLTGKTLKRDYEQQTKAGGKYSPEALELKKAQAANARSLTAARDAAAFPPAPLDPAAREFEKAYTARDGKTRATWQEDPATGKGVWVPLAPMDEEEESQADYEEEE